MMEIDNLIEVRNAITSNGTHISSTNDDTFGIILNNNLQQIMSGRGVYGNLIISNAGNVEMQDSIRVNNRLTLATGILDLGENRLVFGENASVAGDFGVNRKLRSFGVLSDGGIRKEFSVSGGSFTYPIGVFGKYTPVTMNVTSTTSAGTITVKPVNARHPSTRDPADLELKYYWNVTSNGFSDFEITHTYSYLQGDVSGNENNYVIGRYEFPNWAPLEGFDPGDFPVDIVNNQIVLENVEFIRGDYTVGEPAEFTGVDTYFSRNGLTYPIDWSDPNSWSVDGHDGPVATTFPIGAPVKINDGHTVRTNGEDFLLAESVELIGTATLDLEDTFGHNFGFVSGTGTIRIKATSGNQFIFPGGNYVDFVERGTGGTVVFTIM